LKSSKTNVEVKTSFSDVIFTSPIEVKYKGCEERQVLNKQRFCVPCQQKFEYFKMKKCEECPMEKAICENG
jgi:hypothetical protein